MRGSTFVAAAVALGAAVLATPLPVMAFGSEAFVATEGRDLPLGARSRGDRGECAGQNTMCDDPYAYRYVRRPWYPAANTGYWVPAEQMRSRYRYSYSGPKYHYVPAWGANRDVPAATDQAPMK